jgi:flagellar hook assembly protein FlgD
VTSLYELRLDQNYPNPFNPTTTISFVLPEATIVDLSIYDAGGHLIRTLRKEKFTAGKATVVWDGKDSAGTPVSSSVYFYRLVAGKRTLSRKLVVLR